MTMHSEPRPEHDLLRRLVGRWTYRTEAIMAPDQPPAVFAGTEDVRSLGRLWILCEGRGDAPDGQTATTLMTLGFDPARRRVVGTFVASMMAHLWLYEGEFDEAQDRLVLDTTGPSFTDPQVSVQYRDEITLEGADRRIMRSSMLGADGGWSCFMTARYERVM
jgi:hypothetical protein